MQQRCRAKTDIKVSAKSDCLSSCSNWVMMVNIGIPFLKAHIFEFLQLEEKEPLCHGAVFPCSIDN